MTTIVDHSTNLKNGNEDMDSILDTTNLNISTLVYMLETNIKINPDNLQSIFTEINPIQYNDPIPGIIKISVRGNSKGLCKKLVFRRNNQETSQVKNFRNQISFYVRIIDNLKIQMDRDTIDFDNNIFHKDVKDLYTQNAPIYKYKKGQTAFQFRQIQVILTNTKPKIGDTIKIFTSVMRKAQSNQLTYIDYTITEDDIINNQINIDFDKGIYAHSLYIDTTFDFVIKLDFAVEINMFMFTSGKIKIAGCTRESQIQKSVDILNKGISFYRKEVCNLFGIDNKISIMTKLPVMINSDFASNFNIKRYELDSLVRDKYDLISSFEPCTHPAVIIKYYHNKINPTHTGKCLCKQLFGNTYMCAGRGNGNGSGECKTVTILVFQSGKVILTGAREISQVSNAYQFISNILIDNKTHLLKDT
tara:strand:- start:11200 stop:12453 length:1254 start_codon:yes stop_codon:yes gene_type:complete